MSGPLLRLALRLREWAGWAFVMVEANLARAPAPVRMALRAAARVGFVRRWARGE